MRKDEKPDPVVRQRFISVWPSPDEVEPEPAIDAPHPSAWATPLRASAQPAPPAQPPPAPIASTALAALNPGRRAIKALAAVAVIVCLIAAFLTWHSQPRAEVVAAPSAGPTLTPATAAVTISLPAPASAASSTIVVAVTGRVRRPGLVTLPVGARVADAIAAAGGTLPNTDLSFVNLARKVADGELIVIGIQPSPARSSIQPVVTRRRPEPQPPVRSTSTPRAWRSWRRSPASARPGTADRRLPHPARHVPQR